MNTAAQDVENVKEQGNALRLFWWKGKPNFGDVLSSLVVAHISGRPVVHSGVREADLIAVGSLLRAVSRKHKSPRPSGKPWVWGSGMMAEVNPGFVKNVEITLLRGPVTAGLLKLNITKFGDPGLLTDSVLPNPPERQDRIGVVLHHLQFQDEALVQRLQADPAVTLIDPRDDVRDVCHQIASCAHVYSASLHGLIVADSYGVANTWIDLGDHPRLKYIDYAASIGRDMPVPLGLDAIPDHMKTLRDGPLPYADGIARARHDILTTFPEPLKATPNTEDRLSERA